MSIIVAAGALLLALAGRIWLGDTSVSRWQEARRGFTYLDGW